MIDELHIYICKYRDVYVFKYCGTEMYEVSAAYIYVYIYKYRYMNIVYIYIYITRLMKCL